MSHTARLIAAAFVLGAPSVAIAEETSTMVEFGELDLNTAKGGEMLYHRLHVAAKRVCGHRSGRMPLGEIRAIRDCVDDALEQAVIRVNARSVMAAHAARVGSDDRS